jgi:hypothetical protein
MTIRTIEKTWVNLTEAEATSLISCLVANRISYAIYNEER